MNSRKDIFWITLLTALAALTRWDLLVAGRFVIDSDEAIVGLMAKHIIEGREIPIFYYGQHYMGSLEPIVVAILFKLFGVSEFALKLAPFLFSVAITPLVYQLSKKFAGLLPARIAALLWAIPPSPLVIWSSMARGGFIEVIFLMALAAWFAAPWFATRAPSVFRTAAITFVLGVGWWVNNQIVYMIAPVGALMALHLLVYRAPIGRISFHLLIATLSGICGSIPFWIYNLLNSWASFGLFGRASAEDVVKHLEGAFSISIPMLLGAKRFWQIEDSWYYSTIILSTIFVGLALYSILHTFNRDNIWKEVRLDKRAAPTFAFSQRLLFWGLIVTALGAFVMSSFGHLVTAPRYLLPVYLSIAILLGDVFGQMFFKMRLLSSALLGVILISNLASSYLGGRAVPGQPFVAFHQRAAGDHSELIKWLEDHHYYLIETNYWIGYRLAFETRESIKFIQFQEPYQVRIPEYESLRDLLTRSEIPMVLVPKQSALVERALHLSGLNFERTEVAGYVVLHRIVERYSDISEVNPQVITVKTDPIGRGAELILDNNPKTRWGSAAPQSSGMSVTLTFEEPIAMRGLVYNLGSFVTDFPRGLKIYINDNPTPMISESDYQSIKYLIDGEHYWEVLIDPITVRSVKLVQTGHDSFFDWSIADLKILR